MPSLRSLTKQMASESVIYGLSGILTKFIAVFLVPIYTRVFSPAEYGKLSVVNTTFGLLTSLSILALDSAAAKWYWETDNPESRNRIVSTWFFTQLCLALCFCLAGIIASGSLSQLFFRNGSDAGIFVIAACALPLSAFTIVFTKLLRFRRLPKKTMVFSLSVSLLNIVAAICLVLVFKVGIRGFFLATVAATGLGALWAFWELRTILSLRRYDQRLLKEMLAFSLPLVPALLGAWAISQSSIYFLNFIRGKEEVGLFYIGNAIASMGGIFMAAFQQAWGPFAYSIEKEPNAKQFYGVAFFVYTFLGSALALFGSLFGRELLSLFTTQAYSGSSTTICFLIFSYIAAGFVTIASLGCNLSKDNRPVAIGVVIGAAFSIALNLILDRSFGKDGAAAAILIAQLVYSGSVFIMAQRLMPIPYPFLAAYLVFFSFLGIGFLGSRLESIWLKLGVLAGIACLLFLFRRKIVDYVRSVDLPKAGALDVPVDGPNA